MLIHKIVPSEYKFSFLVIKGLVWHSFLILDLTTEGTCSTVRYFYQAKIFFFTCNNIFNDPLATNLGFESVQFYYNEQQKGLFNCDIATKLLFFLFSFAP
jgi:hypothetical protein